MVQNKETPKTATPAKVGPTTPGYEIKVSGQYYAMNPETSVKSIKTYKPEAFQFPKIVQYKKGMKKVVIENEDGSSTSKVVPDVVPANAANIALHLIKNFHITPRLETLYPDFLSVRTCSIFSKEEIQIPESEASEKDVKNMDKAELLQYVAINDLNIVFTNYADLGDARNAVVLALRQKRADDVLAGKTPGMTEEEALLQEPTNLFI